MLRLVSIDLASEWLENPTGKACMKHCVVPKSLERVGALITAGTEKERGRPEC